MQQDDARSAGADGMAVRKDDLASGQSLTMEAMQKVTRPPARRWEPQTRGRLRSPHHVLCIYALGSHLTTLGEEISRTGSFSSNSNSGPLSTPSRSSPPDTFYAFTSWSSWTYFHPNLTDTGTIPHLLPCSTHLPRPVRYCPVPCAGSPSPPTAPLSLLGGLPLLFSTAVSQLFSTKS